MGGFLTQKHKVTPVADCVSDALSLSTPRLTVVNPREHARVSLALSHCNLTSPKPGAAST